MPTLLSMTGREWRGWRTERYTYAVYRKDGSEYLFDNQEDPHQMCNLASEMPELRDELKAAIYAKMAAIGDSFEKNSYYRKHWVVKRRIQTELP